MITISYGAAIFYGLLLFSCATIYGFLVGFNAERAWNKTVKEETKS